MAQGTKVYVSRIYKINGSSIAVYAFVKDEFGGWNPMKGLISKHGMETSGINGLNNKWYVISEYWNLIK